MFILFLLFLFPTQAMANSLIDQIQRTQGSMVEVKTEFRKLLKDEQGKGIRMVSFTRTGAGIVIDPEGLIVTNTHIVENAPSIYVVLKDGKRLPAQTVYSAEGYDFSFIKIQAPYPLQPIQWAESSQAQLSEPIVAIGNSDLDSQSLMGGEITSLIQSKTTGRIELLELNLHLFKGDSGGPIFDADGKLLGIIMGKSKSQERQSFAIASDKIHEQYLIFKRSM